MKYTVYLFFISTLLWSCSSSINEQPLLKILSPKQTGIHFDNQIIENDSINILDYVYLYNGAGVAAGDLNNDGWPDLFFSGNDVQSRLYLNQQAFSFEDITEEAGLTDDSWCTGVALVDINQDERLDIYVSVVHPDPDQPSPNLLYVNQGNNERGVPLFKESAAEYGIADSGYSSQSAFFDYDRDGDLDLYVVTNAVGNVNRTVPRPGGPYKDGRHKNTDRLYRNDGEQGFTNVSQEAGILQEGWGLGIGICDINLDQWPDIYVANDFLSNDILYINQGDGTFVNEISSYIKHQSLNGMGIDIADINNDALPDIVVLDMLPEDNLRQKSMFATISYDFFHKGLSEGYQAQYVRNSLQLNNGNGTFSEIGQLAGISKTDWSWAPLITDFDNDGLKDLLITNGYIRDITDQDYINYNKQASMFGTDSARNAMIGEALSNLVGVKKHNYLYRNIGGLVFEDMSEEWGFDLPSYSHGATFADFDLDGDIDVAINNVNDPAFIFQNQTQERDTDSTQRYLRIILKGDAPNVLGLGTKIYARYTDEQGEQKTQFIDHQIFRGYKSTVEPTVHLGFGAVSLIDSLIIIWPDQRRQILSQVSTNQLLTVYQREAQKTTNSLLSHPSPTLTSRIGTPLLQDVTSELEIELTHKEQDHVDFNNAPLKVHKHSQNGPGMAVGDVNGDGLEDVFVGGSRNYSSTLLIQQADGSFRTDTLSEGKEHEDMGALWIDVDNDQDLDLYVVSGSNEIRGQNPYYQDRLYKNNGKGVLEHDDQALPTMISSGSCVIASDYDRDGDLDLFVGGRLRPYEYPLPASSYLLENDGGQFKDVTREKAAPLLELGLVTSALWTDVNEDGWMDLMVVGEWMPVTILLSKEGQFTQSKVQTIPHSSGWWNSLAAGDFDKDGDMDYVAGNLGQNHRFKASPEEPVCIYTKDFDENGSIDPVLCHFIEGENYAYHPRNVLISQIVGMKRRFPLFAEYGKATFDRVLTEQELAGAYVVRSEYFSSSLLINEGKGSFSIKPLPLRAQFAPIYGILVDDVDLDGQLDILLTGNSYAPDVHIGNYDAFGGLLLKGNGQLDFSPLSVSESGFWVDGDAKSLVKLATPDRSLYLSTQNQGPLLAHTYHPKALKNKNLTVIRLSPSQVLSGSYLAIYDAEGRSWKQEIFQGSGYLSQSSLSFSFLPSVQRVLLVHHDRSEELIYPFPNQASNF